MNTKHCDKYHTLMKYFALLLPRKVAELQNEAQRPQNMNVKPTLILLRGYIYSVLISRDQPQNRSKNSSDTGIKPTHKKS